jgi:hypothetical protein
VTREVVIVPFDEPVNRGTNRIRGYRQSENLDHALDVEG